jgi:chromosome segregation ATPase
MIPATPPHEHAAGHGGNVSKHRGDESFDYARLDQAIESLLEDHARIRTQNRSLRATVGEREAKIAKLEELLLSSNQKRQDAIKRIDDLVSRLEQIDAALERADERGGEAGRVASAGAATS